LKDLTKKKLLLKRLKEGIETLEKKIIAAGDEEKAQQK